VSSRAGEGAPERSFLSIREVLDLLVEEFPDITISKIRFLESRGLIHPERTASGYRKFYESDVERLRWILRQQREHFLPLKVIKGRLEQAGGTANGPIAPSLFDGDFADPPETLGELVGAVALAPHAADASSSGGNPDSGGYDELFQPPGDDDVPTRPLDGDLADASAGPPEGESDAPPGKDRAETAPAPRRRVARAERGGTGPAAKDKATKSTTRRTGGRPPRGGDPGPSGKVTGYSAAELARAAGVEIRVVTELDEYGLISQVEVAGAHAYPVDTLEVVRVAALFGKFGVEPRHLRTFKHAAEREAGLYSQVVTPLLYQRNPEARARALAELKRLVELGASLHEAFVKAALGDLGRG
jgi:DNA-binding transcriptional MerR regulator